MKATAVAPANIAFIKYWGKKDPSINLPFNDSISMNLSRCLTTTTVEFSQKYKQSFSSNKRDEVYIRDEGKRATQRVVDHLERIRKLGKSRLRAKVVSFNSFPSGVGIASSASGFAALTLAATVALGLKLSERQLSILARLGSGSACRSVPDGFVEWKKGESSQTSYALSLAPEDFWDLRDIVVIVSLKKKKTSSLSGHAAALTSPYFKERLKNLPKRILKVKEAIESKDICLLGETSEEEAIDLHIIAMTSKPPIFYWEGKTLEIIKRVKEWREEGLAVYFTIDAGPNVHLICQGKDEEKVLKKLKEIKGIKQIIINKPAVGVRLVKEHLF
ncbi:diphosphomevalonate decarboxylase [Candidatus Gottesmanbacteria bacterium]|nr:diphosphomevalonate decarboxylase [Candidatus Gottesmanbacteria bacterium]